jgi:hypothetical protein
MAFFVFFAGALPALKIAGSEIMLQPRRRLSNKQTNVHAAKDVLGEENHSG